VSNGAHELLTLSYRDEDCDGKGFISATGLTTAVINDVERMKDDICSANREQIYRRGYSFNTFKDRNSYLTSKVPYLLPS
jgi:hypothetical protein